jgi:hypothetical protein
MPATIDEIVKRKVIQEWLAGEAREKITADNDIGAGTVSIIVDDYKARLDSLDLDSFRELILEARKRMMSPADLASFFRSYNFFRTFRNQNLFPRIKYQIMSGKNWKKSRGLRKKFNMLMMYFKVRMYPLKLSMNI